MTFGELRFNLKVLLPDANPDVIDTAINNRLESISRHLQWKALEADAVFVTAALVDAGTLALTNGSTDVTHGRDVPQRDGATSPCAWA